MVCTLGVLLALFERTRSGRGQVVDANMVEGVSYLASFVHSLSLVGLWNIDPKARGRNLLDTGAPFYDTYKTKDGGYMSVYVCAFADPHSP